MESADTAIKYLVEPSTVVETSGAGPVFELGPLAGILVLVILRITEIIEQESLHVSIQGSEDGKTWSAKALFWFPQVFYNGTTPAALDLSQRPEIKYVRAHWEVNRWGRGYPRPHFTMSIEVQPAGPGEPFPGERMAR
jgi:hypothetical protein